MYINVTIKDLIAVNEYRQLLDRAEGEMADVQKEAERTYFEMKDAEKAYNQALSVRTSVSARLESLRGTLQDKIVQIPFEWVSPEGLAALHTLTLMRNQK